MADTTTTNYTYTKPEVGASEDTWGTKLNQNWDDLDADLKAVSDVANAALPKAGGTVTGVTTFSGSDINIAGEINLTGTPNNFMDFAGDAFYIRSSSSTPTYEGQIIMYKDAGVKLLHDGSEKLLTVSTGVDITGSLDVTDPATTRTNLELGNLSTLSDYGTSGQVLSSDGDGTFTWSTPVTTAPPTMQVFTGSGTWTKPSGCKKIKVIVTGGGENSVNTYVGGGAGGTAIEYIDVTSVSSVAVTVGAAGSPAGTSSFGAYCSATGGNSTGFGGVGSGGTLNLSGGAGGFVGYNATAGVYEAGFGGGSYWCAGVRDAQNAPATAYGCGGGGTFGGGGGTKYGASGVVVVEEFY